jgi:hypothetical protein
MSKSFSSRTLTTASAVVLALAAGRGFSADSSAANPNAAKPAVSDVATIPGGEAARVDSYVASNGEGYFALTLPPVAAPAVHGHDIVILFDTSAGQVGASREKALEALDAVLQTAGEHDRVQLMAADLNAIPLTESFVAPRGAEMKTAMSKLRARVPLGATDMGAALGKAADALRGSQQAKTIIYLGDGSSKANALVDDYAGLIDRLTQNHIPLVSYAIGERLDATLLAAIANQTGGMLMTDSDRNSGKEFGARLSQMASAPVVWPSSLEMPKDLGDVYPKKALPMRADRDTVLVGKGKPAAGFDVKFTGDAAGQPVNYEWKAQPQKPLAENAYIAQVVDYAQADGGARLPTVGSEGLHEARRLVNLGAQGLAKLGAQAASTGNREQARVLVEKAIQMDPTNTHAQLVKKQLDSGVIRVAANDNELVAPQSPAPIPPAPAADTLKLGADTAPPPPAPDQPGALLGVADQMRQVDIGRIVADVNRELNLSRDQMSQDPEGVKQRLELMRQNVRTAPVLPADTRAQLLESIDGVLQLANVRERESNYSKVEAQRNAAMAKSNQRLQESLQRGQDRLKQLTLRMESLLDEGRYADAEVVAAEALKETPESADTTTSQVIATSINQNAPVRVSAAVNARFQNFNALNNQYRDETQQSFLVTLHLVDVSSIPFPDEPPIVYPSADRWRQLTKDRERYRSVDLKNPGSAEAKILKALDEPTEMDFVATPLKDVVEALKIRHGIEIQLDTKALTEASITPDTEVTRQLKGISLKSALRLMLQDMDCNYIIDHEVLLITTEAKAKEKVVTKVYPVADLVLPIAINSGLNPFQQGGGLGGQNGFNSGMNGGFQGGGFGGGGFGGGGGGGGQFGGGGFGGGGAFDVADPIPAPIAATTAAAKRTTHEKAARIDVKADAKDLDAAWNEYFAKLPAPDKDEAASIGRERNASVRETVRQLTDAKKFAEVSALLRGALCNGYGQPWMYEALSIAMRADNQPKEEIERALMSAVQFANTTNDLMFIAVYLSREGFDARALKLFRQAAQLEPTRYEPYMHGLEIALRLKDAEGIQWACAGVLSQVWPEDKAAVVDMARHAAAATLDDLNAAHRTAEAKRFTDALNKAIVRDLIVHVSWTGDAEVDISVQEPPGSVCSYRTPRTSAGGVILTNTPDRSGVATGEGISQDYVATEAFPGTYKILLRRVFGKVSAGKVTVDIYTHFCTAKALHKRMQIPLGEHDAVVEYELKDGRRTAALKDAAVAAAAQNMLGVNRALLAQMAQAGAPAGQPATAKVNNRNVLLQQLAAINDPAVAAAFASSRSANGDPKNPNNANGGAVGLLPFAIQGAVGYQPVITTLPEGTNMSATAVVSADRRYVRISVVPLFSSVGDVTTFNFATGAQTVTPGTGGGIGGGPGAGGAF